MHDQHVLDTSSCKAEFAFRPRVPVQVVINSCMSFEYLEQANTALCQHWYAVNERLTNCLGNLYVPEASSPRQAAPRTTNHLLV